jgi:adenylate cyclase
VLCAAAIHKACIAVDGLQLRIGIHQGEVVFEDHDVFGDGVNIASRLQAIADPGEILVSEAVYTNIKNKKEFVAEFFGEETLKNVEAPVKIYRIRMETDSDSTSTADAYPKSIRRKGKLFNEKKLILFILGFISLLAVGSFFYFKNNDKNKNTETVEPKDTEKSIAVLPFTNMSNDPAQDYFADAMIDEILNHLFKIGGWRITSRTSVMLQMCCKAVYKRKATV